jgi:hypothetical protein
VARLTIKKFNIREMQLNSKVAVIGKPGCFAAGTPVLMHNGTLKPVEDVMPRERVMGDDGTPRTILELCRGWEKMYRIHLSTDGASSDSDERNLCHVDVNENHYLVLRDPSTKEVREVTVKDFISEPDETKEKWMWFRRRFPSSAQSASQFENVAFAIEALEEDQYYGFTLDGNHRFLLADFSVVRNTGKSSLLKDLLFQHRKKFPIGLIMSETNPVSKDFDGMVPDLFTYDEYNQSAMDKLVLRQKQMVRKNGEGHHDNFAFALVDDCMDDTSWVNHKTTKGIFKNGRHWDLFFLLAMQYCLGIPPTLRTCLDYVFILREPNLRNRRKLWENYASIFPTFQMFCDALDDLTQDYHCMVIKNRVLSNKIEDVVFWYKAKLHTPFRIGRPEWWRFANAHTNSRYEMDEEEALMASQRPDASASLYRASTRAGPKLVVNMEDDEDYRRRDRGRRVRY